MRKEHRNLWMLLAITVLAAVILSGCGGAQSSPEKVARAWVEAVVDGDCRKARTYWSPNDPGDDAEFCGPEATTIILSARITEIDADPGWYYSVHLYGSFDVHETWKNWGEGRTERYNRVQVVVEEVAGKYYVVGFSTYF